MMKKINLFELIEENKFLYKREDEGPRISWALEKHYQNSAYDDEILFEHIKLGFFKKEDILLEDIRNVIEVAHKVAEYVDQENIITQLKNLNAPGNSSSKIQDIFINFCIDLGFESEKKELFKDYNLRPDYYKKLNNGGILLEVERGKTISNNMDIYDLWKCHICEEASHLFLFVPHYVSHTSNIYESSRRRLKSFFTKKNSINVDSLFLFGY